MFGGLVFELLGFKFYVSFISYVCALSMGKVLVMG